MSEPPKFTVIDRRKIKAEEESESTPPREPDAESETQAQASSAPAAGPRLVVSANDAPESQAAADDAPAGSADAAKADLPAAPTAQESHEQKMEYDASAQRLEDLIRAQNPGAGAQPPITFEHLVQQFYVSAMIQMGAGTEEGQRPRVDILGARASIDLLGILAEKTRGNLTDAENRTLQSILFELRMAFLELTSMISMQPPAPPDKH
jgi:Domain of unknown function (DUF1844)